MLILLKSVRFLYKNTSDHFSRTILMVARLKRHLNLKTKLIQFCHIAQSLVRVKVVITTLNKSKKASRQTCNLSYKTFGVILLGIFETYIFSRNRKIMVALIECYSIRNSLSTKVL